MKKFFHYFMLLSVLLPLVNPSAATAPARRPDSADASQPLLPPGFVPPTSAQAPAWTERALHNPTWQSASTKAAAALYSLQGAATQDSALSAAAVPQAPQDLGDWSNTAAAACIFSLGPILNFNFTLSLLVKPPPFDFPPVFGGFPGRSGLEILRSDPLRAERYRDSKPAHLQGGLQPGQDGRQICQSLWVPQPVQ